MGCLFLTTLGLIEEKHKEDNQYPWLNWLIWELSRFIFNLTSATPLMVGEQIPFPYNYPDTLYSKWFEVILMSLKKEFFDATDKLTYAQITNPITEEIAMIIYYNTDTSLLILFNNYLERQSIVKNV